MEPDVDQNVNIMPIVPVEWRVFVNIVEIRVVVFVDQMPNATLLITFQFVLVKRTTKAIRSPVVDQFQDCVSFFIPFHLMLRDVICKLMNNLQSNFCHSSNTNKSM